MLEPDRGGFVTLARVSDNTLLRDATNRAIEEAEHKAAIYTTEDVVLGELQRDDTERLRRALLRLAPGLEQPDARHNTRKETE